MSGVLKSVKKVFKKVVKVVKKVLPIILAAAAIYFTAGAALGVAGTAGGWGAAASSLTSQMGATGMLGNVLTGAITQAGYGAAVGAGLSAVTGGDPLKGAQRGALTGAITGGVMGGVGLGTDPLAGIGEQAPTSFDPGSALPADVSGAVPGQGASFDPGSALPSNVGEASQTAANISNTGGAAVDVGGAGGGAGGPPADTGSGIFGPEGWIKQNEVLSKGLIKGGGEMLGSLAMPGESDGRMAAAQVNADADAQRRAQATANFTSTGTGLLPTGVTLNNDPRPRAPARFNPANQNGRWQYDPSQGRLVFIANA